LRYQPEACKLYRDTRITGRHCATSLKPVNYTGISEYPGGTALPAGSLQIIQGYQNNREALRYQPEACKLYRDIRITGRHCATSRKVAGSIPDGVIGIFQ